MSEEKYKEEASEERSEDHEQIYGGGRKIKLKRN